MESLKPYKDLHTGISSNQDKLTLMGIIYNLRNLWKTKHENINPFKISIQIHVIPNEMN